MMFTWIEIGKGGYFRRLFESREGFWRGGGL